VVDAPVSRCRVTVIAATALVALCAHAGAQPNSNRGASVVLYPLVASDAATDTVLQLASLAPGRVYVRCHYIDGASWQAASFDLELANPMQPIHWVAAHGRSAGSGDVNDVPAAPADFRGALLCVQVDGTGAPLSGNRLVGQATRVDLDSGDVAGYAAIGLIGSDTNDGDPTLCIGGEPSDVCPIGREYDPCPAEWVLNHPAEGAADPQLGPASSLNTRLSVMPCSHNLRDNEPATVDVALAVTNEFEERFSGSVSVTCWADLPLADIAEGLFERARLGSDAAQTRLAPAGESGGFVLVSVTERRAGAAGPVLSRAASDAHHRGAGLATDLVVLP
jgi:hypothetical protein